MPSFFMSAAVSISVLGAAPSDSQTSAPSALTYADLADLALVAPVVVHVRTTKAVALKTAQAGNVAPGHTRFYVEAKLLTLIRGKQGLPAQISYVIDFPTAQKGRAPHLRKNSQLILFARPVPGSPGTLQLVAPDAQLAWTAVEAERLRAILTEANSPSAPPAIAGIGRAFHVPGALPGESETQIFLRTANNQPISINILRRPGETPFWAVALSEIVDEAAAPPRRDSLLWYRLACTLPPALPRQSLAEAEGNIAAAIQADYRLVMDALGPCARTRVRR